MQPQNSVQHPSCSVPSFTPSATEANPLWGGPCGHIHGRADPCLSHRNTSTRQPVLHAAMKVETLSQMLKKPCSVPGRVLEKGGRLWARSREQGCLVPIVLCSHAWWGEQQILK